MSPNAEHDTAPTQPNAQMSYEINGRDLPLCCPLPSMSKWNSHPRVYLPIEPGGEAKCPYCGASFRLTAD